MTTDGPSPTLSSRRNGDCSPHGAEIDIQSICQGLHSPQGRGVVTTDLCPHQQDIILPPLAGGLGRGPVGPLGGGSGASSIRTHTRHTS